MCTKQAKYRGIPGILLPRQLWNSYRLATEQLEILNIIKTAKILAGFPQLPLNADNLFCVAPEQLQIGHRTVRDFEIIKTAKILAGFPQLPLNADNLFCVAPEQLQIGHGTVRDFEHYIDP